MKIKVRLIFILGFITLIAPQIGIRNGVKQYIYYICGIGICWITYSIHKQLLILGMKKGAAPQQSSQSFVDSIPKNSSDIKSQSSLNNVSQS